MIIAKSSLITLGTACKGKPGQTIKKLLKDAALVWSPKLVCKLTKNTMLTLLPTMSSKTLAMLMSDGDVLHTIHLYMSFISCNYDLIGFCRYNHNHALHKATASFGSWRMFPPCIHPRVAYSEAPHVVTVLETQIMSSCFWSHFLPC